MQCVVSLKIFIFHIHFLNMDISLIKALSCLKICMYIAEICLEGRVSQYFEIGLRFCLMVCGRRNFERKTQKITKVTRFWS